MAEDIVNYLTEEGLCQVIKKYGEDKRARLIARAIVDARNTFGKLTTTKELADIVANVYQGSVNSLHFLRFSFPFSSLCFCLLCYFLCFIFLTIIFFVLLVCFPEFIFFQFFYCYSIFILFHDEARNCSFRQEKIIMK